MEDTECACRYGVLRSSLVSDMGIGIGVSHHHFTGASPEDDTHAEGSQDPFLHGSEGVDQRPHLRALAPPIHPQAAPSRGRAHSPLRMHVTQPHWRPSAAQGHITRTPSTLSNNTNTIDDCSNDNFEQHRPTSTSTYDPRARIRPQSWTPCATPRTGGVSYTPGSSHWRPAASAQGPADAPNEENLQRHPPQSPLSSAILEAIHEDDELSSCPAGSKHYEGVVMAGSPARVADEGANDQEQEQATAAPTTMASRMHASERGLRHSPAVAGAFECAAFSRSFQLHARLHGHLRALAWSRA